MTHMSAQGWPTARLGDVAASIEYGYTASAADDTTSPLSANHRHPELSSIGRLFRAATFPNRIPRYLLRQGDIVFARTGATTGKAIDPSMPTGSVRIVFDQATARKPFHLAMSIGSSNLQITGSRSVENVMAAVSPASCHRFGSIELRSPRDGQIASSRKSKQFTRLDQQFDPS